MEYDQLIQQYLEGPGLLRDTVAGMDREELDARPAGAKWSTRDVVCHLADFESIYADRMKRVIVETEPTLFGGDPDEFALRLAYNIRDVEEEIVLIVVTRKQVGRILRTLKPEEFQRVGIHTKAGPLTLQTLLERITGHISHHIQFIEAKKRALAGT